MGAKAKSRLVIGLNSGTSADGADAAACEVFGRGPDLRVRYLGRAQVPFPPALRDRLLAAMAPAVTRTEEICRLDAELGRAFADAAIRLRKKLGLKRLDLVGSHGQTICHRPPQERTRSNRRPETAGTFQIGDPAAIAAAMNCPVVHRFRQADMALGGQGAPLVPWTDYVLFRHPRKNRVVQNIGGIANLTWLPAGSPRRVACGDQDQRRVLAFDCGPGNMLIDGLVRRFSRGRLRFDRGGRRAAKGRIRPAVLADLLRHPFLSMRPPKSCGREQFGERFLDVLCRRHPRIAADDWIATATNFSVAAMVLGYAMISDLLRRPFPPMDELILCGGGARNTTMIRQLKDCLKQAGRIVRVARIDEFGIPCEAKEAVSFAILAVACADGVAGNLPQVTGASRPAVLGSICSMVPN